MTRLDYCFLSLPYQTTYSIKTNCETLVSLLQQKYGEYVHLSDRKADFPISVMEAGIGNLFEICTPYKLYSTSQPLLELDEIIFDNTNYDRCIFALHGAAVEWKGKGYLFLAATTSGKTTLASYLTSRGFGYITDDCILLDRTDFQVYPYHTPLHLRDGGVDVLKRCRAVPDGLELLDDAAVKRYVYTPKNCVSWPLPLEKIFFITRTENKNQLLGMNTTEQITELMKAPITNYQVTAEYLKFISRLAKTGCSRLLYCDMDFVAEVIRNE